MSHMSVKINFKSSYQKEYSSSKFSLFSKQEYQSGLQFSSPGDLPDPEIEPSPALQADSLPSKPPGQTQGLHSQLINHI